MQRILRRAASPNETTGYDAMKPFEGLSPRMSSLLRARGIVTEAEAQAYLHPSLGQRNDPMLLHDMDKALRLLEEAKTQNKRFIVYGDYDVDGICATAIMVQTLLQYGLEPPDYPTMYRIPDRHEEGYGLNEDAVRDLIGRADILVTVDCGITSVHEVAIAKEAGMQVIVTDHHALPDVLPPADAVIDPLMAPYPFSGLCGAGVAYQLCRALLGEDAAQDCLDLAALATVADMVPLRDENRAIVAFGLKAIENTKRPGLQALIRVSGYREPMRSEHIAFGLAPRMNACGRLQSALMAVRLLFEDDEEKAELLAFEMNRLNNLRKEEERAVLEDAEEQIAKMDLCRLRAIVVSGTGYDSGVVGLAAGRIAEKYGYPTVVLAEGETVAVGSARSVTGVDIYQALKTCQDLFTRFGGHPQAAGMTLKTVDIPAFRERLSEAVISQIGRDAVLMPTVMYDDVLDLSEVNEETVEMLKSMEPFGMDNPAPVFYRENLVLWSSRAVGQNCEHLKCELMQGDTRRAGIAFRHGDLMKLQPRTVDVVFSPVRNEFRGTVTYECQISRMLPRHVTIVRNAAIEAASVMRDLLRVVSEPGRAETPEKDGNAESDLDAVPLQGVLIYCRCADTARMWSEKRLDLDLRQAVYRDACAYSAIVYGVDYRYIHAPYRTVILADGDLTGTDRFSFRRVFPDAEIIICPTSKSMSALLNDCAVGKDELRNLYSAMRKTPAAEGIFNLARNAGLSTGAAVAGACVLGRMELVDFDMTAMVWSMKPLVKRDPEAEDLYQLLQARKEGALWHIPPMNL